jgi:predicted Zn finger-like uncharacterized protein
MYTVCPKCALALAVAAADLRAGQGYVRCGRCANVFNALLGLTDESALGAAAPAPAPPRPVATAPRNPLAPDPPPEEIWLPTEEEAPPPAARPAPTAPTAPAAPAAPTAPPRGADVLEVEEFRGTGTFETIVLEGDTILQTEEQATEEEVDIELADVSRRIEAARSAGHLAQIDTVPAGEKTEETEEEEEEEEEEPGEAEEDVDEDEDWLPPRARPSWLGIAAIVLLVLLLAGQGINHWRNDLATYGAWFSPLERLSAAAGESLHPNWDLGAYDVHQLGASTDTADPRALKVRLSLANRGLHSQALPLVRLSLLDRYGTVVSSGDLQPAEYLPPALHGQRFIASEQRIDTEVSVMDPTQQVSSFELDVCVPAAAGGLRCAGDTPVLSSRK